MDKTRNMCCYCEKKVLKSDIKYHCQSCGRLFCGDCIEQLNSSDGALSTHSEETVKAMELCKHCLKDSKSCENGRECSCKVYPSESPRDNAEPPSPSFSGEGFDGHFPDPLIRSNDTSFPNRTSPASIPCSPSRSDEDEVEDLTSDFFGVPNDFFRDASDVDSSIISSRDVFYSLMSVESSRSETTSSLEPYAQKEQGHTLGSEHNCPSDQGQTVIEKPNERITRTGTANILKQFQHERKKLPRPLNFETSDLIWLPPPPEDANDEMENKLFTYDDEDDESGDSGGMHFSTANIDISVSTKDLDCKEPMRAVVLGHFRALVSQLLRGQGVIDIRDDTAGEWLEIITAIAWQAAKFIKPNTNGGGSMDPCDYLKIKCVASGSPRESKLVKGVVCTKNIKHKRMMSQYKNARLLVLGGALEYQKVPNQLASMEKLIQQENDHMRTIVAKIEAHRPNVLLVEKSVSSIALEHLLSKEISLVLNVKRSLLEKIAKCTGAIITPSTDQIPTAKLGHCELFRLEKVSEDHEPANQFNRKPLKTLMFFEGCPRRLGCTVVLRGSTRAELKKVKHVVQYAVFAAYHLSLETSFLTDEGASLPNMEWKPSNLIPEGMTLCKTGIVTPADSMITTNNKEEVDAPCTDLGSAELLLDLGLQDSLSELASTEQDYFPMPAELGYEVEYEACEENLHAPDDLKPTITGNQHHSVQSRNQLEGHMGEVQVFSPVNGDGTEASSEYYLGNDSHQSILVSFSSHSLVDGTVCERSRLLRVKFYGPSDKPLGRYLRDDLFGQSYLCESCNEPAKAHVIRYTHQHAIITINVRHLPAVELPGERDGKVWMWHRCLQCELVEGVPPATGRVVMSDAAWGLSFGKFLELSFSNHATGNRVATCGHSLQRDCLRFYGCGSMVASFLYSHIDTLSVYLPPSILEFSNPGDESWIRKETYELLSKAEALYAEISSVLGGFKTKILTGMDELAGATELQDYLLELNDMLVKEKYYYKDYEREMRQEDQLASDIVEINNWRHSLLIASRSWNHRLYLLDSLLKRSSGLKAPNGVAGRIGSKDSDKAPKVHQDIMHVSSEAVPSSNGGSYSPPVHEPKKQTGPVSNAVNDSTLVRHPSAGSILSDKIDYAWSGVDQIESNGQSLDDPSMDASEISMTVPKNQVENLSLRRTFGPDRVYSFDSAQRAQERINRGLPPSSLYLTTLKSFHASGDFRYMVRDPVSNLLRTSSNLSPHEAEKPNLSTTGSPYLISSASLLPEGARLMVLHNGQDDVALTVYDNEPTSIVSYALFSREHEDWIFNRPTAPAEGESHVVGLLSKANSIASDPSSWQSFGSTGSDFVNYRNYRSEHHNGSPHLHIFFEDELSNTAGKVKFSVTCYFAKEFDALRKKCCPNEMDFIHSLSRCKKWSAQGGKSNVYFAKSFDERFVIKQVTKTELESFEEFAPGYFKYLTESLSAQSPTCLAKILGMYQVTVKHMKGGKEMKMDLMVMENLFFKRNISKIYDLKGSARSRYVSDTSGSNKVLLDMNLLETLGRNPIFVGSKAKRNLERAIWNDTSFLASVDVMDYSLLVGVDEERRELVMGIIDFMRQYTWDKHLETWVKASGILGGPKNASPTIVSPKQYKKRFRKAMTSYFLAVPDHWSSP